MRYGSICSGIECVNEAWSALPWSCAFVSEIDAFASAVLDAQILGVPNLGDFTKIGSEDLDEPVDLIVGGTPCQSFSVAGQRAGLDDPRGNLALEYCRLLARLRPRWFIWENVPGVLSSWTSHEDGEDQEAEEWEVVEESDFASIISAFTELGYGLAWRTLDAQYFGVPQRRRRVFVVGHLGDWRPAAAVLFERESLCGDLAEGEEAGEEPPTEVAGCLGAGDGDRGWRNDLDQGAFIPVTGPLQASGPKAAGSATQQDAESNMLVVQGIPDPAYCVSDTERDAQDTFVVAIAENQRGEIRTSDVAMSLSCDGGKPGSGYPAVMTAVAFNARQDPDVSGDVTHPLDTDGHSQGVAMMVAAIGNLTRGAGPAPNEDVCPTLLEQRGRGRSDQDPIVVGVSLFGSDGTRTTAEYTDRSSPLLSRSPGMLENSKTTAVQHGMQVRRLTPIECERLQGLPDDYTRVPWRGKPADACPDGPRYKAIGNGMAVPVMTWIGERIQIVESLIR